MFPLTPGDPRVPQVTVTVGGVATSYFDTGHVLDTGGLDLAACGPGEPNESQPWRAIGTTGIGSTGDFRLSTPEIRTTPRKKISFPDFVDFSASSLRHSAGEPERPPRAPPGTAGASPIREGSQDALGQGVRRIFVLSRDTGRRFLGVGA